MGLLALILSAVILFRLEIIDFLKLLTPGEWILLLTVLAVTLVVFRNNIKFFIKQHSKKITYISWHDCKIKILKWVNDPNFDQTVEFLLNQLERNIFTKIGLLIISISIFSYFPQLLTTSIPIVILLVSFVVYFLLSLGFRKEILFVIAIIFFCATILIYFTAFLSYVTGENIFKTLPLDIVYFLNLDINNLLVTSNKLFLFYTVLNSLIFLALVVLKVFTRAICQIVFHTVIKIVGAVIKLF